MTAAVNPVGSGNRERDEEGCFLSDDEDYRTAQFPLKAALMRMTTIVGPREAAAARAGGSAIPGHSEAAPPRPQQRKQPVRAGSR